MLVHYWIALEAAVSNFIRKQNVEINYRHLEFVFFYGMIRIYMNDEEVFSPRSTGADQHAKGLRYKWLREARRGRCGPQFASRIIQLF